MFEIILYFTVTDANFVFMKRMRSALTQHVQDKDKQVK